MTNKEAAKILNEELKGLREQWKPSGGLGKFDEAMTLAIAALKDPMLERRKAGAKGGQTRAKKYKARDFKKWGKMGGRPKKKAP